MNILYTLEFRHFKWRTIFTFCEHFLKNSTQTFFHHVTHIRPLIKLCIKKIAPLFKMKALDERNNFLITDQKWNEVSNQAAWLAFSIKESAGCWFLISFVKTSQLLVVNHWNRENKITVLKVFAFDCRFKRFVFSSFWLKRERGSLGHAKTAFNRIAVFVEVRWKLRLVND